MKERLKSWAVWLSVFGAVGVLFESVGVFEAIGLNSIVWDTCVNALGTILVAFGILNNPTDRNNF